MIGESSTNDTERDSCKVQSPFFTNERLSYEEQRSPSYVLQAASRQGPSMPQPELVQPHPQGYVRSQLACSICFRQNLLAILQVRQPPAFTAACLQKGLSRSPDDPVRPGVLILCIALPSQQTQPQPPSKSQGQQQAACSLPLPQSVGHGQLQSLRTAGIIQQDTSEERRQNQLLKAVESSRAGERKAAKPGGTFAQPQKPKKKLPEIHFLLLTCLRCLTLAC
ncbi:TPA: hypothetical protein ACH3X1_009484 [Trebouxia sp. C0004]